ncbi:hypothetical protein RI367_004446 [Sorochytrium milnesiophthora]
MPYGNCKVYPNGEVFCGLYDLRDGKFECVPLPSIRRVKESLLPSTHQEAGALKTVTKSPTQSAPIQSYPAPQNGRNAPGDNKSHIYRKEHSTPVSDHNKATQTSSMNVNGTGKPKNGNLAEGEQGECWGAKCLRSVKGTVRPRKYKGSYDVSAK